MNTPCPGTHSRAADVFCGLSGRFVGIRASNQVLQICGIVILGGNAGAPTGYWEMVGSGQQITTTFERGVERTDGLETTTSDKHTVSISIEQEFEYFATGSTTVELGYEYSREIERMVKNDITKHTTTGCQAECITDGNTLVYVY